MCYNNEVVGKKGEWCGYIDKDAWLGYVNIVPKCIMVKGDNGW